MTYRDKIFVVMEHGPKVIKKIQNGIKLDDNDKTTLLYLGDITGEDTEIISTKVILGLKLSQEEITKLSLSAKYWEDCGMMTIDEIDYESIHGSIRACR